MAAQHRFWVRTQFSNEQKNRVVEHELDMNRDAARSSSLGAQLRRLVGWLTPERRAGGNHSRSVERELEEAFPSRDN